MQVQLPPQHQSLALYFSGVVDSCEVFANGRLIGHIGGLPPAPKIVTVRRIVVPIPDNDLVAGGPVLLAIRVWQQPAQAAQQGGGIYPAPKIGEVHEIGEWSRLQESQLGWKSTAVYIEIYNNFLTALAGLALFALRRKEREYLWWGVSQLLWAWFGVARLYAASQPVAYSVFQIATGSLMISAIYFQIEFLVTFLRQRRSVVYYVSMLLLLLPAIGSLGNLFPTSQQFGLLMNWARVGLYACQIIFLWNAAKKRNVDAWVLLVPYTAMLCIGVLPLLIANPFLAATTWSLAVSRFLQAPTSLPFQLGAFSITGAFEMYAVLAVLVIRYARSRKDEERMEAELEAARTVQRILIPEEIPAIAGFAVRTVYKPASQVGGDFFQIIRLDSGGVLIVIGDVSGKGMPAAMTVSLLVGTFRTLAHYSQEPSEILSAMNQRMLARSKDGFTTCLVLRIDPDGRLTIANAGHLSPFLAGKELVIENSLPIGLAADTRYSESIHSLAVDSQLTLVTDGVVEARNQAGELFGFERAAAITKNSAESIAQAAQEFGQEDDITVLTVTRLTVIQEASIELTSPELSPSHA
jgi:hypothetical protein